MGCGNNNLKKLIVFQSNPLDAKFPSVTKNLINQYIKANNPLLANPAINNNYNSNNKVDSVSTTITQNITINASLNNLSTAIDIGKNILMVNPVDFKYTITGTIFGFYPLNYNDTYTYKK